MDVAKPKSHHGQPRARGPAGGQTHAQSFLALTALGVVFGDIGTSPLYTFSTALTATGHAPSAAEVRKVSTNTHTAISTNQFTTGT